jgi:hypothetical protein
VDELLLLIEPNRSQVQDNFGINVFIPEFPASFDTLVELLHL